MGCPCSSPVWMKLTKGLGNLGNEVAIRGPGIRAYVILLLL
jgi:hypothetical protein